eukprot:CAMPEP_0182531934 /NCGR_PEP_ID=MMETSP1323-20130603/10236_1 /TAXON_ID=236787 /ORGANISM="Florenciella parvula, Strain RCC1693" /LENGTH=34 /DNA_ID= /DNA_START= /DNA_END= /DNA_ORIENTATION=
MAGARIWTLGTAEAQLEGRNEERNADHRAANWAK